MMRVNLCEGWEVRPESLETGPEMASEIVVKKEDWLAATVPGDVRQSLLAAGLIREPLEGLNCFDSEWVEKRSWWFRKTFPADANLMDCAVVELVLESLDFGADIFLNNKHLGCHLSSFYPFRMNIRPWLQSDENILLIRLTTGLERVDAESLSPYAIGSEEHRRPGRGDRRRAFLRKPQYTFGWDWNPRVATCGIVKPVWLEGYRRVAIRQVHVATLTAGRPAMLRLAIETENFHPYATIDAILNLIISRSGKPVAALDKDMLLRSGLNDLTIDIPIADPQLWWPNGMGEQPLYRAELSLTTGEASTKWPSFDFGIRTVELDQSRQSDGKRRFTFIINDLPIFCKGGNWIPADSLYSRADEARYGTLIDEARAAGFNMLRVWGGGLYESDIFYDLCDRAGILLWHDFMFACSEYPDDQPWFITEAERELDHQTRHLANHPALALWSGNNENHWAFASWWPEGGHFGAKIYNYLAPAAVRRNCPEIPYWNSSPYGGEDPNSAEVGDRHHWHDCMMNPEMIKRIVPEEYDRADARFISEYGYVGPLKRESVQQYFGDAPIDIASEIWHHHTNTFEEETVAAGIRYQYADPEQLDLDQYLHYAGLCQGLMLQYSLEAFRYKLGCSGGLFWMYNDCWGETGWTIIDHQLRRKIAWYYVKRALNPVKVILRADSDGQVTAVGINEQPEAAEIPVEYGSVSLDGGCRDTHFTTLRLAPHSRGPVLSWMIEKPAAARPTLIFMRPLETERMPLALLQQTTWRQFELPQTTVEIIEQKTVDRDLIVTVASKQFAHAVHFNLPADVRLSDDYFDLLPATQRQILIYGGAGLDARQINPEATASGVHITNL